VTEPAFVRELFHAWDRLRARNARRSSYDRHLAGQLFQAGTDLRLLLAAIRLATARLALRPADAPNLPAPRSLAYILPVVEELRRADPDYINYVLGDCPNFDGFE
jgi:hypothetical protein